VVIAPFLPSADIIRLLKSVGDGDGEEKGKDEKEKRRSG